MKLIKRLIPLLLALSFLCPSALAAKSKIEDTTIPPREVPTEIIQDIPEKIQQLLDLAYSEMMETDGKELKKKNKYTKWRNNYEYGWCGGFITYCMLQLDIPQLTHNKIKQGEVDGIVHVKEAGVGKLYTGYEKMNRVTRIPQKGFIAVFGNTDKNFAGTTGFYHVGLVWDVELLPDGKYRITTIEGNVPSVADETHKKAHHTVVMYVRDYDPYAEKKQNDVSLVPEEERDREENSLFSYGYTYGNKTLYINCFLMPWVPGDPTLVSGEEDTP